MRHTTILILDDEQDLLTTLRGLIESEFPKADVMCADSIRNAIELIRQDPPDLAIVDLHVPTQGVESIGTDAGYGVVHLIKRENPQTQVIVYTGYSSVETAVRCMRAGASDFIRKGEDYKPLLGAVRRAFELRPTLADRDSLKERLIISNWDDLHRLADPQQKGSSLESLCSLLFRTVPGWQQIESRIRTSTEEIDLVIVNESAEEFWKRFGPIVLVECKHWTRSKRPGRNEFDSFYAKLQRRAGKGCRLGFFVSLGGVATTFKAEMNRIAKEDTVIVAIDAERLWALIRAENRSQFLKDRVTNQMLS